MELSTQDIGVMVPDRVWELTLHPPHGHGLRPPDHVPRLGAVRYVKRGVVVITPGGTHPEVTSSILIASIFFFFIGLSLPLKST